MPEHKSLFQFFELFEKCKVSKLQDLLVLSMFFCVLFKTADLDFKLIETFCSFEKLTGIFVEKILTDNILDFLNFFLKLLKSKSDLLLESFNVFWHLILNIIKGEIQVRCESIEFIYDFLLFLC